MGITFLMVGFIFFFLPNLTIIDILPDFLGCILIMVGLNKLADLTPGLAEAKRAFLKALYIYIAKFLLMFTVPFFGNSDGGYILIFSFSFAILEMIFVLPAFSTLLNGFVYLGDRTNASILFKNQSEFSTITKLFLITRSTLAFVPDLAYISNPESSGIVVLNGGFYISNFRTLLVGANFLITGILGIVWLYYALRYFLGIKNDRILMSALEEKYKTEILPQEGLFTRRNIKNGFVFITVGGILMFDLLIDNVNVIPDFLGAFFFLIAALLVRKRCNARPIIGLSGALTVISLVSWIVLCVFAVKFPAVNIRTTPEAYDLYVWVAITASIKYVVLLLFNFALYSTLKQIIQMHTGSPVDELNSISVARKRIQAELIKSNLFLLILGLVCCLSGIYRIVSLFDFPSYGVIDSLINAIYVVYLIKLLTSTNDAVEYRYL